MSGAEPPSGGRAPRGVTLLAGLLVFFAALALYARTLLPDIGLWDTAEFQTLGPVLGIAHPTGYPTYTLLAWLASVVLAPFGEPALRANLLSAILAAGGAGLTAVIVGTLSRRPLVGFAAGIALALSGAVWAIGLRADAHALHLALVALLLLLLLSWAERQRRGWGGERWLLAAAVVFGVSLGNHALTILLAPGIALFLLAHAPRLLVERLRFVLACALALLLTTILLYAYLPLRSAMDPPLDYANPETWEGFRYLVFAEQFRGTFQAYPPLDDALTLIAGETLAELGLFAVLALVGALAALLRRPQLLLLLAAWFAANWVFALSYLNADIERYRLAPILSVAVLGGLGAAALLDALAAAWRRWRAPLPSLARAEGAGRQSARPGRGPLRAAAYATLTALLVAPSLALVPDRFTQVDQSEWLYGREWLEAVLPRLEPGAVVVSWWAFSTPLWYAQFVEGRRPDIFVADDRVIADRQLGGGEQVLRDNLGRRPVYLLRLEHDLPAFHEEFVLTRVPGVPSWGAVWKVERRR